MADSPVDALLPALFALLDVVGKANAAGEKHPQARQGKQSSDGRTTSLDYPVGHLLRRVQKSGQFRWAPHYVFLTRALHGEVIGLEALDEREYRIWFGPLALGVLDSYQGVVRAGG